ncbi:DUF559 domain-containing protein [uncultured Jatrophihabitans sp.]|uniref:DUF559 domain-containing protein n=1 Tax=uncultured Jatrophihabitans sp. TaxID=1610747 RepID=UPI0035CC982D
MTWRTLAAVQSGVVQRRQLRDLGLSDDRVDRMARAGALVRVARGVYLVGGAPWTFQAKLWTAVLATRGVLCLGTAGQLWGVTDAGPAVHVAVPAHRRVVSPTGVVVHHRRLHPADVRNRDDLPLTSRSCTVLDLMATLPPTDAERLADRALQRGWVRPEALCRRLDGSPRTPGNAQLRRLAAQLRDGAAAESERILHRLLRRAGVTGWRPNHRVWSNGELVAVVDVAFPAQRLAIEVDGMAHHVDVDRFRRDRSRQNALVSLGWTVLRFTWADLTQRPGYVVAMIQRLAA